MSKVYLPQIDTNNCVIVKDKDTIRVYDNQPVFDSYSNYTDYYVNSHYLEKRGQEFITDNITCIDSNIITTEVYYRSDFDSIMIILFLILLICFYFPFKIISRLFGRWLKL